MKELKVEIIDFDELTEDQKAFQPNNGSGKEYANYLKVTYGDEIIAIESDAMEPEDVSFYRDLSWIRPLIIRAFNKGRGK